MIACFRSNISAKYYKNPSMLSRVIAKNVGDVFFETQCTLFRNARVSGNELECRFTKFGEIMQSKSHMQFKVIQGH